MTRNPAPDTESDPIISSYSIYLADSAVPRVVLQYLDRDPNHAYDDAHGQKPTSLRLKPETGLVEVDVPLPTRVNYDIPKGLEYGEALRRSRVAAGDGRGGGSGGSSGGYGMAGGFSGGSARGGSAGAKVKTDPGEPMAEDKSESAADSLLRVQTLGGRIKVPEEGDPVYMLATFRDGWFPCNLASIGWFCRVGS